MAASEWPSTAAISSATEFGVDGHRDSADHLRRRHRPVEPWTIGAGDGNCVATIKTEAEQPLSDRARLIKDLSPGPGLPNAEILVTESRTRAALRGMRPQQLGEGVIRVLSFARRPHAGSLPIAPISHRAERMPPPRGDARGFSRSQRTIQQGGTNDNSPTFVEEGGCPRGRETDAPTRARLRRKFVMVRSGPGPPLTLMSS